MSRSRLIGLLPGVVLCFVAASSAPGAPVTLELKEDSRFNGRAVLYGDLDETAFGDFGNATVTVKGNWWEFEVSLSRFITVDDQQHTSKSYDLTSKAQHISPGEPPHPDDTKFGFPLTAQEQKDLKGIILDPHPFFHGPQDASSSKGHPGDNHVDTLTSHLVDHNGSSPGWLSADNEIEARLTTVHTPLPAAAWGGMGLLVLLAARTMKRGRR